MDCLNENFIPENSSNDSSDINFSEKDDSSLALQNSYLQAKIVCLEKNVKQECVDDVLALAQQLDSEDVVSSIDSVLEKYPFFKKTTEKNLKLSTGVFLSRTEKSSYNGIEAAFKRSNPNVKL